jgi:tetratricopeptide (TPR) repeat protein
MDSPPAFKSAFLVIVALPAVFITFALPGCGPGVPTRRGGSGPQAVQSQRSPQDVALDYVSRIEEFEPQQGMRNVAYNLNRWLQTADDTSDWVPTPLLAGLPEGLRSIPALTELDKLEVTTDDVLYLREASWMRSISRWVMDDEALVASEAWLDLLEQELGEPHAHDVAVAVQLFDWTIRNIQADPLLDYPESGETPEAAAPQLRPLYRAEAGPGYRTWPWQTLMFGRGDAWQRIRVFAGLARQQQIDVVLLAVQDDSFPGGSRPWLAAALVDERLYLFDAQLGLPIPGPDGAGVATLQQVREDPQLLRSLDLGQSYIYPFDADDLDNLVVLLDASPEALSRRMKIIDANPTSGQQLTLSIDADDLVQRLAACGLRDVELWPTPYKTWIYRRALMRRAEDDVELIRSLFFEEWLFNGDTPLIRARQQYFRGNFDKQDDREGAKALYLQARVPNTVIAKISTSPKIQQQLGIVRGRENDQQWEIHLQSGEMIVIRSKQNASLWLGLIHYSTGRYDDARVWFQTRCLEAYEDGPWTASARYNLARTYEQIGDLEAARELYLLDDSPQKHGNLLRARALRKRLESARPE